VNAGTRAAVRVSGCIGAFAVVIALSGCQLGDYADGAACDDVRDDIVPVITHEMGLTATPDSLYPAGATIDPDDDPHIWCVLSLDTGQDISRDDPRREAVRRKVTAIVAKLDPGAYVTITYASIDGDQFAAQNQDAFLSPGTPALTTPGPAQSPDPSAAYTRGP
jgi:hypothetical protein